MNKQPKKQTNNDAITAIAWASLVVAIEVITEFTGIRKYKLNPEPKTFIEVIHSWPIFLISGIATFLVVYFRQNSKRKQINEDHKTDWGFLVLGALMFQEKGHRPPQKTGGGSFPKPFSARFASAECVAT